MRLNQKGFGIVELAAWMIVVGFLGITVLIGSAITSPKTQLEDYKAIHKNIPDNYNAMTPEEKRIFWRKYFDAKGEK